MDEIEQEIDLDQITDESLLQSLLDQTDDPEDRKVIRDRIKELRDAKKVEQQKEKERIEKLTNTREEMLKQKKREAELHKQKTAAMYDNMAKSAPAGAEKKLDTQILRAEPKKQQPAKSPPPPVKEVKLPTSPPITGALPFTIGGDRVDYVEDAIKRRQREAEERKRRILASYDIAAKSQPAGTVRDVDLDSTSSIDIEAYENQQRVSSSTFQMSGGVPVVKQPTPIVNRQVSREDDSHLDVMERALRERQRECEERKQKILEQYNQAARGAAGPKVAVI